MEILINNILLVLKLYYSEACVIYSQSQRHNVHDTHTHNVKVPSYTCTMYVCTYNEQLYVMFMRCKIKTFNRPVACHTTPYAGECVGSGWWLLAGSERACVLSTLSRCSNHCIYMHTYSGDTVLQWIQLWFMFIWTEHMLTLAIVHGAEMSRGSQADKSGMVSRI